MRKGTEEIASHLQFLKEDLYEFDKEEALIYLRVNNLEMAKISLLKYLQALNEQSKKVEKETGITGPQLWAIKVINESAPIKVSELANRLYLQ